MPSRGVGGVRQLVVVWPHASSLKKGGPISIMFGGRVVHEWGACSVPRPAARPR